MILHGTQGYDPQSLRQEVARGARFVIYPFCVSVVVMTFKRNSGVYFVKPGQSRVVKGLPYALVTLVAGWWGIPWGPIYSIQTLVNTLMGGVDVTSEVLATLPSGPGAAAPLPPEQASRNPSSGQKVAIGAAIAGSLVALVVSSVCIYRKTHLPVYLLSGNAEPYTVKVDGRSYVLQNGRPVEITCSEGDIEVIGDGSSPAAVHHYALSAPFFDHLFKSKVGVINPDGVGIFFEDKMAYYVGTPPDKDPDVGDFRIFANQDSWMLEARDFQFCDFPAKASVPSGSNRAVKTRLNALPDLSLASRARLVSEKLGYPALRSFLDRATRSGEEDDVVLGAAWTLLKDPDYVAFLARGRAERPVRVEWHRYYQNYMGTVHPDVDIRAEYERLWAEHPEEGAYAYLLTRVIEDRDRSRQLTQQALEAKRPCAYAHVAASYYALSEGNYDLAAKECREGLAAGVKAETLKVDLRQAELGQRNYAALLSEQTRDYVSSDLEKATREIGVLLLSGAPATRAEGIGRAYIARKKAAYAFASAAEADQATAYFKALIAYGQGDEDAFATYFDKVGAEDLHLRAVLARRDAATAFSLLERNKVDDPDMYFLCYVVAMEGGHDAVADACFRKAVEALAKPRYHHARLAALLSGDATPTAEDLLQVDLFPTEKRTFLAAMAYRYPVYRDALARMAAKLNVDPMFPYQTIRRLTDVLVTQS